MERNDKLAGLSAEAREIILDASANILRRVATGELPADCEIAKRAKEAAALLMDDTRPKRLN